MNAFSRRLGERISARSQVSLLLLNRVGWTTSGYVVVQVLRFAQNLVLTHFLAPELFGVMVVLTSLRVGIELFTDIGIGQGIVASKEAWDPRYYNTAWTVQLIRGVAIGVVFLALTPLIASFYDEPTLNAVFPVLCVLFIATGAHSVGPTLAVKAMDTKRIAAYEVVSAVVGAVLTLCLAWFFPTVWGLVAGNIASTLASAIISYFVWPGVVYKLRLDWRHVKSLVSFGKWIFISSIIFFLASNFDRLILSKYVSLGMLGVYGIARSFGDIFSQFGIRLSNAIIFPSIASADVDRASLRHKLGGHRRRFLVLMLVGIASFIALSDIMIRLLYDNRYEAAGQVTPWVGLAAWLLILNTVSDSVMLGLSKPNYGAIGNVCKFLGLLVLLPWFAIHYGIVGAAVATVAAEILRYLVLMLAQARERIGFIGQDAAASVALVLLAVTIREGLGLMGLVPGSLSLFGMA